MDYVHAHFRKYRNMRKAGRVIPQMRLKSGFVMSVQASTAHQCQPKDNAGPYSHVEMMFLTSTQIPAVLKSYAASNDEWGRGALFTNVPVEFVNYWITLHGGLAD